MTLAAAYRIGQVPALLSDLLLSGPGHGKPHEPIPTRVDLTQPLPLEWQVAVKGLARKCVLIGTNAAVAVAGSGLGASFVCRKVQEHFRGKTLTANELAQYLATVDDALSAATSCQLVGWVVERANAQSFLWDSARPSTITWNDDFVIGSGAELFKQIAWSPAQRQWGAITEFDHAQHYALTQISSLLINEMSNGAPIQNLFGGGYDLLLWNGSSFRLGSGVTFLLLSIDWLRSLEKQIGDKAPILLRQAEVEDSLAIRCVLAANQLDLPFDRRERAGIVAPITALSRKHKLSRVWDWAEIPHFADRIFVIITGIGPKGTPEHWAGGVLGEDAKRFILDSNPINGKTRFMLPIDIMDAMRAKAGQQFSRTTW